jgi:hypothetical protein
MKNKLTYRRSWTIKPVLALSADSPSEIVKLARALGYAKADYSQAEWVHSIRAYVMFNVKNSKMLVDPRWRG